MTRTSLATFGQHTSRWARIHNSDEFALTSAEARAFIRNGGSAEDAYGGAETHIERELSANRTNVERMSQDDATKGQQKVSSRFDDNDDDVDDEEKEEDAQKGRVIWSDEGR